MYEYNCISQKVLSLHESTISPNRLKNTCFGTPSDRCKLKLGAGLEGRVGERGARAEMLMLSSLFNIR